MNTRTRIGLFGLLLLLLVTVYWGLSRPQPPAVSKETPRLHPEVTEPPQSVTPAPQSAPQTPTTGTVPGGVPPEKTALFRAIFSQSISLHGLVLDQNKQPIEGAKVRFGVHDNPNGSGSEYFGVSDVYGRFAISDLKGAAINTEVSKEGYYNGQESRRILKPGEPVGKDAPLIFVLYKKGNAEPIIYLRSNTVDLPAVGGLAYVDFNRGFLGKMEGGLRSMRVEIGASPGRERGRDWEYKIIVPGGGLQRRSHEFEFSAPEGGYSEIIEGEYRGYDINDPKWRGSFGEEFFAQLADGTFARFRVNLGIKGGVYVEISELVYNPKPGSRNLEFDSSKIIKP